MTRKRLVEFDLIRGLAIISAAALHFRAKSGLQVLEQLAKFHRYFSDVGVIFFFISGYMASTVYLNMFKASGKETSKKLLMSISQFYQETG